jgi:ABC-type multidrug transport system ATPase subunit
VIAVRDLCLALDGRPILDHVSLDVARGEAVALVGSNGSGKTSVLRCLLGLVPFTGRASIGGRDVVGEPVAARAQVGYVPQKAAFGEARAAEVLVFVARLRGVDAYGSRDLLRLVGLEAHAGDRVRTFSGGMQQRLALAVALLGDPPVLLLDEPSASLDAEGQSTFFTLIERLRGEGRALVLASHRAEEVTSLTDRIVRLEAGRIVGQAPERGGRVIPLGTRRGGERA